MLLRAPPQGSIRQTLLSPCRMHLGHLPRNLFHPEALDLPNIFSLSCTMETQAEIEAGEFKRPLQHPHPGGVDSPFVRFYSTKYPVIKELIFPILRKPPQNASEPVQSQLCARARRAA